MVKSRSWFKPLVSVFFAIDPDEQEMHVQFARLAVLYEDLRIEVNGSEADHIGLFDGSGINTRRFYFVRRMMATLTEVDGAVHKLNLNRRFKRLKQDMPTQHRRRWDEAVRKFAGCHDFLVRWRNHVGGHLLDGAARHALEKMEPQTVGVIEVRRTANGKADLRMPFAYELVAGAMIEIRPDEEPLEEFIHDAFVTLTETAAAATSAIQVLAQFYLLDRFR